MSSSHAWEIARVLCGVAVGCAVFTDLASEFTCKDPAILEQASQLLARAGDSSQICLQGM